MSYLTSRNFFLSAASEPLKLADALLLMSGVAEARYERPLSALERTTSVGGVLTGRGADIIIIDDPLKPEEALSQTQRRAANEWFDHTLYSRLNDKEKGAIVLIMHRLHESLPLGRDPGDDLVGHVLAQEDWEVVRFPAIAEADERYLIDTLAGPRVFTRARGEALHPARESIRADPQDDRRITPRALRPGGRRPVPAGPGTAGRRPRQGGLVPALRARRNTGDIRPRRAELGHRQQGDRAQ